MNAVQANAEVCRDLQASRRWLAVMFFSFRSGLGQVWGRTDRPFRRDKSELLDTSLGWHGCSLILYLCSVAARRTVRRNNRAEIGSICVPSSPNRRTRLVARSCDGGARLIARNLLFGMLFPVVFSALHSRLKGNGLGKCRHESRCRDYLQRRRIRESPPSWRRASDASLSTIIWLKAAPFRTPFSGDMRIDNVKVTNGVE